MYMGRADRVSSRPQLSWIDTGLLELYTLMLP